MDFRDPKVMWYEAEKKVDHDAGDKRPHHILFFS